MAKEYRSALALEQAGSPKEGTATPRDAHQTTENAQRLRHWDRILSTSHA